jgi:hypothetical protein
VEVIKVMRTALVTIAFVCLLCAYAGEQVGNPVTNGGFEIVGADGFPVDWEAVGGPPDSEIGVSNDAHSGKHSLRLLRIKDTKRETGLNRAWKAFSGEQGAMLSQLKGAILFWYKAVSAVDNARLVFYVIPMSSKPLEDTGLPRAYYTVPKSHIGDGKWHKGIVAYDFTQSPKVKWVQVAPRIVGGRGEWLLDDISYVERAGPVPQIHEVKLIETKGKEGEECTLRVKVRNAGDEATPFTVELVPPKGLRSDDGKAKQTPSVQPGDWEEVEFRLLGLRVGRTSVRISVKHGEWVDESEVGLSPKLEARMLRPERFILQPNEEFMLSAIVKNEGTACADGVTASLQNLEGIKLLEPEKKRFPLIRPGKEAIVSWRARAINEEMLNASVEAKVDFMGEEKTMRAQMLILQGAAQLRDLATGDGPFKATVKATSIVGLQSKHARLIFVRTKFGYGMASLQVRRHTGWETVGKIPYLARLVFVPPNGERVERLIFGEADVEGKALVIRSKFADAFGGDWEVVGRFELTKDPEVFSATYMLTCDEPRQILIFEGPMVYVGEGSFGAKKDEAIFPGLEWLVNDEESSNSLDIAPEHPDRVRYVPHPNKVTIPAVGIHFNGVTVGLMWDMLQRWDGENTRPLVCFASPDWFEGRNSHLVGLFLPSFPWVEENRREASKPYELSPKKSLTLRAELILDGDAKGALSVLEKWFSFYGVIEPLSPPHGSYEAEVAFSTRAYFESLWIPQERKWWTSKGGNPLLSQMAKPPHYLFDLYMASVIVADKALAQKCKQFADEVMRETPNLRPIGLDEFGFTWGEPLSQIINATGRIVLLIDEQNEDGTWSFRAVKKTPAGVFKGFDYRELGEDGAVEVGTCARRAYEVLRFARMTGERKALEAGLKALKAMKKFNVPRAAQVWEIPVHTPDILAASDAVDANIEGYLATGNKEWLEEAKRWAFRGLPFVYFWNVPELPFMRYASIPVFGATWFKGSWFGRAVQWNGLRFAYALLKLSDYDNSFPWRRVAEGLTVSAMYQQDQEGEDVALWPDSVSLITGKKVKWVFSPAQILKCVYKLIGRDPEPATKTIVANGNEIRITTRGEITSASIEGGSLKLSLKYPTGQRGQIVIFGLKSRANFSVDANGAKLQKLPQLSADKEGWFALPAYSALLVALPQGDSVKLTISGFELRPPSLIPKHVSELRFEFETDIEGWLAANDVTDFDVSDGCMSGVAIGNDPYLIRPNVRILGDDCKKIRIRMSVTGGTSAQFYWATEDSPQFSEDKSIHFKVLPDGQFHIYEIDVGSHAMWRGKRIRAIRLDPTSASPNASFKVDWIRGERQ